MISEAPIDPTGPLEGDHDGSDDVREAPLPSPGRDQLPDRDSDVNPEDGGGHIRKS
jgi:hypothetical protein